MLLSTVPTANNSHQALSTYYALHSVLSIHVLSPSVVTAVKGRDHCFHIYQRITEVNQYAPQRIGKHNRIQTQGFLTETCSKPSHPSAGAQQTQPISSSLPIIIISIDTITTTTTITILTISSTTCFRPVAL